MIELALALVLYGPLGGDLPDTTTPPTSASSVCMPEQVQDCAPAATPEGSYDGPVVYIPDGELAPERGDSADPCFRQDEESCHEPAPQVPSTAPAPAPEAPVAAPALQAGPPVDGAPAGLAPFDWRTFVLDLLRSLFGGLLHF